MEDAFDSMILVSGPSFVRSGLKEQAFGDDVVMFVNSGGCEIQGKDCRIKFQGDAHFLGGDVIETNEIIAESGGHPLLYQSARYGDFRYMFDNLVPGDYFVDLHFAEIVNTNGPKGIRVFDIFVQEEKILSSFDIYAIVGANKPLQLVDIRVSVLHNQGVLIRFEGLRGSPTVSGICIRKAPVSTAMINPELHLCTKCATEIEASPIQKKLQSRIVVQYEKKIQELTHECKMKSDECYEAWMSLTDANQKLQNVTMELDNMIFQNETLERAVGREMEKFKDVSDKYKKDKKLWSSTINNLEKKIKAIKEDHMQLSQEAHDCANSIPNLNSMITAIQALVAQSEDLKVKYNEEMGKRKRLFNQLQESKGNIRVFCRCRPLSKEEISSGCHAIIDFDAAKDGEIGTVAGGTTKKSFKFDRVYTPKDNQADVYADASPFVTSVLDGYNVCIFAYGQTGTGKTFTMEGTENNRGVNYRTLEELFKIAVERKDTISYSISVSVLEVYNEQIRDLLATSPSNKKLEVRQAAEGFHHVPGMVEAKVENMKEAWNVLQSGSNARAVGSNNVNEHSSRSHCMLCIMVRAKNLMNGECTKSKLWLVDLAGSERLTRTDVQGERLKEAQNINRSLSALGDVISALASKSNHIPYRNSKLTHLLQDSLGGDSKALMFVQISPSDNDMGETVSSLTFASRVRGVELGLAKRQVDTVEQQKMKQMLDKVRQESRTKDESLRKFEENCQHLENKLKEKEQQCRMLQEKNKDVASQLNSNAEIQSQLDRKQCQLMEKLNGKEEESMMLRQKVWFRLNNKKITVFSAKKTSPINKINFCCLQIKDMEQRLKERQQIESVSLQEKVEELELKLNVQSHSEIAAKEKVKELECQLKESLQFQLTLEQKVKELESKLREHKESDSILILHSADRSRIGTPAEAKGSSSDESTSDTDPGILRSSTSINRLMTGRVSILHRGISPSGIKRKGEREHRISVLADDTENHSAFSTNSVDNKTEPMEINRSRKLDQAKTYGRITRTSKVVATHKLFPHSRIKKDQQTGVGVKEKNKVRGWAR
ncbi:kinesin-like protein KIN-14E isoform X2 [Zingiber officinale]|uniref:kinesin-like protein KIN-14E isoform X2 n=1 Tax=Zingiber officinale TaxID=94328 RepID=UPI001C4CE9EE|nr:kinesin-like protein KIN-14E isoform X2 [Zingiber officinale]